MMFLLGAVAFVPIGAQLYRLMISQYDYYSKLALRNQTRTTTVTADRGSIYDRNMNILAASVTVENAKGEAFRGQFVGQEGTLVIGEQIDAMSGATITSTAVVTGVNAALAYVANMG